MPYINQITFRLLKVKLSFDRRYHITEGENEIDKDKRADGGMDVAFT
jgi:hypothetical protein